jgi:lysophospholipase L1-like esterase
MNAAADIIAADASPAVRARVEEIGIADKVEAELADAVKDSDFVVLTHDITFVDFHTPMKDERNGLRIEFGEDGVHPNVAGYLIMEPLLEQAIALELQKIKSKQN